MRSQYLPALLIALAFPCVALEPPADPLTRVYYELEVANYCGLVTQAVHAGFHSEIAEAIAARDGAVAERLMYDHLSDVQQHIYRHIFPLRA